MRSPIRRQASRLTLQVDRFMAAQAIMLALSGVPGIYFHSLFGSRGWPEGVAQTGHNRTINRQKLERAELEAELADPRSLRAQVFRRYTHLLRARATSPAFHPNGGQRAVACGDAIFALLRTAPDGSTAVLCLQNVSDRAQIASGIADAPGAGHVARADHRTDMGSEARATLSNSHLTKRCGLPGSQRHDENQNRTSAACASDSYPHASPAPMACRWRPPNGPRCWSGWATPASILRGRAIVRPSARGSCPRRFSGMRPSTPSAKAHSRTSSPRPKTAG